VDAKLVVDFLLEGALMLRVSWLRMEMALVERDEERQADAEYD
jgi:hypothetical protein